MSVATRSPGTVPWPAPRTSSAQTLQKTSVQSEIQAGRISLCSSRLPLRRSRSQTPKPRTTCSCVERRPKLTETVPWTSSSVARRTKSQRRWFTRITSLSSFRTHHTCLRWCMTAVRRVAGSSSRWRW